MMLEIVCKPKNVIFNAFATSPEILANVQKFPSDNFWDTPILHQTCELCWGKVESSLGTHIEVDRLPGMVCDQWQSGDTAAWRHGDPGYMTHQMSPRHPHC